MTALTHLLRSFQDVPSFRPTSECRTTRAADVARVVAGALLRLMDIALARDGVASDAFWRGGRRSPLVPPRRAASRASRSSSSLLRPFGCSPPRSAGLPVRSCRPPRHSGPGCGVL